MSFLVVALSALGLLAGLTLGTETRSLFFWPGAALLGLAAVAAVLRWRQRLFFVPSDVCMLGALLAATWFAGRAVASPVRYFAREDLVLIAAAFVLYSLSATTFSHPRRRLLLLGIIGLVAIGNLAVGFIQLSGQWDFSLIPGFSRPAQAGRIGGFFANANHLAAFLSLTLFLTSGWLFFGRLTAMARLWLGFFAVALCAGITLTISRAAMLGIVVGAAVLGGIALWLVWRTRRHLFGRFAAGGAVTVVVAAGALWISGGEYLRARMDRSPLGEDVRFGIWEAALAQHATSPLVGAGARAFQDGSIQFRSPKLPVYSEEALFAHNEYLQALADYGWLGCGLMLLVMAMHLGNGFRYLSWFVHHKFPSGRRLSGANLASCAGAIGGLVAALVHAAFEFHFHVPATVLGTAALLGILANPGIETASERPPLRLPPVRIAGKLAMAAAALFLLFGVWRFAPADYYMARSLLAAKRGLVKEQLQHLSESISADPDQPEASYRRGLVRLEQVHPAPDMTLDPTLAAATADLQAAVRANPHAYLHRLALADAYDALGRHDAALAEIQQGLRLAPLHEEPRVALGIHWHRLGDFAQAEMAFLWARQSKAWNEEGTGRWIDHYRFLLDHARMLRDRKSPTTARSGG